MSIKRIIKAMGGGGGGGGGRGGRRGGGDGSGGGEGDWPDCGKAHKNCSDSSKDSYCDRILGHSGKHKCGSCRESF